jgi:hypothetical protein
MEAESRKLLLLAPILLCCFVGISGKQASFPPLFQQISIASPDRERLWMQGKKVFCFCFFLFLQGKKVGGSSK